MAQSNRQLSRATGRVRSIKIDKRRSFRRCLSEAFDLLVLNVLTLIRSLWLPIVLIGLCLTALVVPAVNIVTPLIALVLLYAMAALAKGAHALLIKNLDCSTRVMTPLPLKASLRLFEGSTVWAWLELVCFSLVCGIIVFASRRLEPAQNGGLVVGLCAVVCLLLSVPAILGLSIAHDSEAGRLGCLLQGLKLSSKHFGSTLAINFLSIILIGVIAGLFFLPVYTLGLAERLAGQAAEFGEQTDLPGSVPLWHVVLCVVWGWICSLLLCLWWLAALLHLRSIRAKK